MESKRVIAVTGMLLGCAGFLWGVKMFIEVPPPPSRGDFIGGFGGVEIAYTMAMADWSMRYEGVKERAAVFVVLCSLVVVLGLVVYLRARKK